MPDLAEQLVEQLAGLADERLALLVLVEAGRLADEHQVGVGVAGAEHDRSCGPRPAGTSGSPTARGRGRPARRGGPGGVSGSHRHPRSIHRRPRRRLDIAERGRSPPGCRPHAERRHEPRGPADPQSGQSAATEQPLAPAPRSGGRSLDRRTRRSARRVAMLGGVTDGNLASTTDAVRRWMRNG